jgi:hypothetical protein
VLLDLIDLRMQLANSLRKLLDTPCHFM